MKKQNPLIANHVVSNPNITEDTAVFYADALQASYEAGLLTDQEHADYWLQIGDTSKEHSYFYDKAHEFLLKLAAHQSAIDSNTDNLFKFNTDHGILDIRPILKAINWAGGIEAMAGVLDTVLFNYIDSLSYMEEGNKEVIRAVKDLRTMLLRSGSSVELDAPYRIYKQGEPVSTKHLDFEMVQHRILSDDGLKVA
jgi:hypothetical protein